VKLVTLHQPRLPERRDDSLRDDGHVLHSLYVREQQRELVASHSGDGVAFTHKASQPFGDVSQQLVTEGMADGIVDDLEPVEVKEDHRAI
jgi:hypothetical protein